MFLWSVKVPRRANRCMHFMALKTSRKLSGFVIYTYLKASALFNSQKRCKVLNKVCERGTIS